ncbi:unnamed protein product [Amaranthus hypochondriacus]
MKHQWRRALGRMKDRSSIIMSSLTLKTRHRHCGLEGCIIKATSHNDSCMDYKSVERVFAYVKTSPSHLIIFLWALTRRIERTRNWVVALKSLILFHGVLSSKAPGTRKIGRLPFNLSCFEDGYVTLSDRLAFDLFVQAYFVFVDLKSVTLSAELNDDMVVQMMEEEKEGVKRELVRVQRWQKLMGVSLNVKPCGVIRDKVLVIEAMDCMIIEVLELYSKINQEIDEVLERIYKNKVEKCEVLMVIDVLHKANKQGDDLCDYFEFCRKVGLIRAPVCVEIKRFSKDDFLGLEKIINGNEMCMSMSQIDYEEEKEDDKYEIGLKTVITDKWEVFDEEFKEVADGGGRELMVVEEKEDPFASYCSSLSLSSGLTQANHLNPFLDYYADRPFQQEQVQMLSLI